MTISVQGGRRSPKTSPAIFSNDVIITKETYKGKELVVIEEDEDPDPPFVHEGPFRLMDLPAELRVYIYSFLMPYNMVIKHEMAAYPRSRNNGGEPGWCIEAEPKKKENEPDAEPPAREVKHKLVYLSRGNVGITTYTGPTHATCNLCVSHQLFLVNKAISNEALSKSTTFPTASQYSQLTISRRPLRLQHLPLHHLRPLAHAIHAIPPNLRPLRHPVTSPSLTQPPQHPHLRAPRRARPLGRQAPTRPS
jgi:hypothetical protein